jgi:hypothetical protein
MTTKALEPRLTFILLPEARDTLEWTLANARHVTLVEAISIYQRTIGGPESVRISDVVLQITLQGG